jgi:chromosome segregation ATPase
MATYTIERRERARAELEEMKKTIEDVEARLKSLEDQVREKGEAANDARSEAERVQASLNQAKSRVHECEAQITVAKDSEKNVLAPRATSMKVVIKKVQKYI